MFSALILHEEFQIKVAPKIMLQKYLLFINLKSTEAYKF